MVKLFSQFIKESLNINEALQSDVLRKFVKASRYIGREEYNKEPENLVKSSYNVFHNLDSSRLTDDDFIIVPFDKARTSKYYNNYVYFWFKDEQPIGVTQKGEILFVVQEYTGRGYGRSRRHSSYRQLATVKEIQENSNIVYGLSNEKYEQSTEVRQKTRSMRYTAKEGATALMTPEDFKKIFNSKIESLRVEIKRRKAVQSTDITQKMESVIEKAAAIYARAYVKVGEEHKSEFQKVVTTGTKNYSTTLTSKLMALQGNIQAAINEYASWIEYGRKYESAPKDAEKYIANAQANIDSIEKMLA